MNRAIITIPKRVTKGGELVVLSRQTYEQLVKIAQRGFSRKLDADLLESLAEVERGAVSRSFRSVPALMRSLRT